MALVVASCGDDDQDIDTAGGMCASDEDAGPYFLYENPDWESRDGADYAAGLGPLEEIEPSLDWSFEYERFTPSPDGAAVEGVSLRLSGHYAALVTQQDELPGFQTDDAEIADRRAYTGVSPEGEPTVVGLDVADDYTLMLLSYGLPLDDLVEIAASVNRVCQRDWIEAGGEILDCDPFEAGCIRPSSTTSAPTSTTPTTITTTTGP